MPRRSQRACSSIGSGFSARRSKVPSCGRRMCSVVSSPKLCPTLVLKGHVVAMSAQACDAHHWIGSAAHHVSCDHPASFPEGVVDALHNVDVHGVAGDGDQIWSLAFGYRFDGTLRRVVLRTYAAPFSGVEQQLFGLCQVVVVLPTVEHDGHGHFESVSSSVVREWRDERSMLRP